MTPNDQKSALSEAWVRAIAATAGFGIQPGTIPDDQSADITVTSTLIGQVINPRLDIQLKASHTNFCSNELVSYPLDQGNYDTLRSTNVCVPMILVLLEASDPIDSWMIFHPDDVVLQRRAWWHSLRGLPSSGNVHRTTINIPDSQRFTPKSLTTLMTTIRDGGTL